MTYAFMCARFARAMPPGVRNASYLTLPALLQHPVSFVRYLPDDMAAARREKYLKVLPPPE